MEKQIIELFLYNHKLKFSEIEKQTKLRSNKISYHLKNLLSKNILSKKDEYYSLSEEAEKIIPYLSDKNSVISVILIAIKKGDKIFLIKRIKRPFDKKLCLPGGRLIVGESISKATKRLMKEKFNINAKLEKINSISLEHVKTKNKSLHSFLLILVTASTKESLNYSTIKNKKSQIISSDYKLIKEHLDKETKIETFTTPS